MRTLLVAAVACGAVAAGYLAVPDTAASPVEPRAGAPVPPPVPPARLVAHEWGTFTSFSGSDGEPMGFRPNNTDLPHFVYYQGDENSKAGRLFRNGLVSMETPVVYFYTDKETRVSVKVDFPKGWITEWYPFASGTPVCTAQNDKSGGQSIRWDVKLLPNEAVTLPRDHPSRATDGNHYFHARATDAVPLQAAVAKRGTREDEQDDYRLRGGTVMQHEKFLFYRGVGTFPPPVTVRALGGDKVRVRNHSGGRADGLVLVTVRGGKLGFRPVGALDSGAETVANLPEVNSDRDGLAELLVKELTGTGLYEKEAKAMVKTWDSAWFGEEGSRLLYLVPRAKTDELLPLTMDPKPTELVRVLVGRHDFLTPEQEATAEQQVKRARAAEAELNAAQRELSKLGRFRIEAEQSAAKRIDAKSTAVQK
ncbi:hypothetical protein VT84_16130 [Gemmata sp. SH-PL17]|uniref:hypothetical protein n=1 Tax=Gemmata sp. SH-PL17 TaxID=1630693 RepID=UPI00078C02EA|nr:hypothetical protein [Gemmata sp. SH-PL17]AMV25927.1 hypothetical protein VT84_16130 [Gemmata sp. SH-PL17]